MKENACTSKLDFLFRFVPPTIRQQLLLDDEAFYSTTDQMTAEKITQDIIRYVPRTETITDATACIGGSAYSFSQVFQHIIAIELDQTRFLHMVHNLRLLQALQQPNITCIHGDALHECQRQNQAAIFIDPPWGGPDYKNKPKVSLYLSGVALSDVCRTLAPKTQFIILKVPTNFDEESFIHNTLDVLNLIHKNISLRKMHLLILKCIHE